MALFVLWVISILLVVVGVGVQIFLYLEKVHKINHNLVFAVNVLFALLVAHLAYWGLPSNLWFQKLIAIFWALLAIGSIPAKYLFKEGPLVHKLLLTVAILGGILQFLI